VVLRCSDSSSTSSASMPVITEPCALARCWAFAAKPFDVLVQPDRPIGQFTAFIALLFRSATNRASTSRRWKNPLSNNAQGNHHVPGESDKGYGLSTACAALCPGPDVLLCGLRPRWLKLQKTAIDGRPDGTFWC